MAVGYGYTRRKIMHQHSIHPTMMYVQSKVIKPQEIIPNLLGAIDESLPNSSLIISPLEVVLNPKHFGQHALGDLGGSHDVAGAGWIYFCYLHLRRA